MLEKQSIDQMLLKASSHAKKGEILEAQKLYQAVLLAFPKNITAQQELAGLNKPKQNNVTLNPPKEAVNQLINLYNKGQISSVVEQAQAIIKEYPEAFIVWNILGASAAQIEMLDLAITAFQKVISLKPNFTDAYYNMGVALKDQGKMAEAIEAYKKALSIKPDYVDACYNMADILKDQGKLNEAIESYKKALSIKPDYAEAYNNLGVILKVQGKLEEAIEAYRKALSLKPDYADAYYNIAYALKDQGGKLEEAIEACKKSISLKPDYAESHQRLSFLLLTSGKLQEGLDENEWRWKTSKFLSQQRYFLQPLWDGKKSLNGKRILLWSEQGIGDTINWSSCLSLVSSQAEHCILECQEKLVPLLERSFPNVEVKAVNKSLDTKRDDFDYHLPMGSLYKHFLHEIIQNPKPEAYLIPDPVRVNFWKERLNSIGKGPYVGICWKSSVVSPYRLQHYPPISEWSPILKIPDVTFINLQYTDFANDLAKIEDEFGVTVHNFDDLNQYDNIDDVAALCTALDIVVSTKIAPLFISSAVGTSTKIANWKQSSYNNILTNPVSSSVEMFERDTWEPWDNVFRLIAEDILELKNNTNKSNYKLKKS
jgi:tetratricopeptide (TPR) repeat protein